MKNRITWLPAVPALGLFLAAAACEAPDAAQYRSMAFSAIAAAQVETGDLAAARESAALAKDALESADRVWWFVNSAAAAALARTGDMDGALELRGESSAIMLPAALAKSGAVAEALALAESFPEARERSLVLSFVAVALAERGDLVTARRTAALAVETGQTDKDDAPLVAVWAQARTGDVASATTVADMIADEDDRDIARILIARAQIDGSQPSDAVGVAEGFDGHASSARWKACDPGWSVLYPGLTGDITGMLDTWWECEQRNPIAAYLGAVAIAQAKSGHAVDARRTASAILARAQSKDDQSKDDSSRTYFLMAATIAYSASGDAAAARASADLITDPGDRAWVLGHSARLLARHGLELDAQRFADLALHAATQAHTSEHDWVIPYAQAAAGWVEAAIKMARQLDKEQRDFALFAVALLLTESGDLADAATLAKTIVSDRERQALVHRALDAALKAGTDTSTVRLQVLAADFDDALRSDDHAALIDLARQQAQLGAIDAARKTLVAATAAALHKESEPEALFTVLRAQAMLGADEDARRTATLFVGPVGNMSHSCSALDRIIDLSQLAGDLPQRRTASAILADLSAHVTAIQAPHCRVKALAAVADAQRRIGESAAARRTLESAQSAANDDAHVRRHPDLLVELARVQKALDEPAAVRATIERALSIADGIAADDVRLGFLADIAKLQAAIGEEAAARQSLARAIEIAEDLANPDMLVTAFVGLAEAQEVIGDMAGARISAARAARTAETSPNLDDRNGSLRQVGFLQLRLDDVVAARATFATLRRLGGDDELFCSVISDLLEIAKEFGERGAVAQAGERRILANELAHEISQPLLRMQAGIGLAHAWLDAGDRAAAGRELNLARDLVQSISDPEERPEAVVDVATALAGAGQVEAALGMLHQLSVRAQRDATLRAVTEAEVEAGDFDKARLAALAITGLDARVGALLHIAERQLGEGDPAGGAQVAALAAEAAKTITSEFARSRVLSELAVVQAKTGDTATAAETLSRGHAVADALQDPSLRARALTGIATAQARMGEAAVASESFSMALAAAKSEGQPFYSAMTLVELAEAQFAVDDVEGSRASIGLALEALLQR